MLTAARRRQIDNEAIRLRWEIWERRAEFWPGRQPHPLEVLDPQIAAQVLGAQLEYHPEISFGVSNRKFETAGVLDRNRRMIAVAQRFGPEVALFTAAHELGHLILHEDRIVLHRDLPIRGLEQPPRDPLEAEANYFAGTFLMPAEFLKKVFKARFGAVPFVFDDAAANYLRPDDPGALVRPYSGSTARSVALATARSYAGRPFGSSLAEFFKVSTATMAIRLREVALVQDWP